MLLDAVESGKVMPQMLGDARMKKLREHPDPKLRARAASLLKSTS
jgi:hypothetical protein